MPTKKPRHRKATLFQRFMLVLLGLFLLVVFELVLRLFGLGTLAVSEDPFVGFSGHHPVFETYRAEDGSLQARTVREKLKWFNEQQFPVCKDSGTFRIFTLGGSTAYGRPYRARTSFSGWLEEVLKEAAEPARHFEVINAAGISYASYVWFWCSRKFSPTSPIW